MIGQTVGHYVITGKLGSGGMGVVYLARDSKLKREVAVKVLPEVFARDAERLARFQREAEVLASLNHPRIAAIYDVVELAEQRFLILELVDGDTLADRIAKGPLPMEEALQTAAQVAEALEAAHEKGVIHRDLKPANIKITSEGSVKVLDFGLAKVRASADSGQPAEVIANSPTVMSATMPGTIMGTAAYMSPEQAKGKEPDRTCDVWSFGCVLYEMLTGEAVFQGETQGELLGEIFKTEPDWSRLPPDTPPGIRRLLRRCLQKSPRSRMRDMRDVRLEIEEAAAKAEDLPATAAGSRRRERLAWVSIVALFSIIAVGATAWTLRRDVSPEMRLEITTGQTGTAVSIAISPDGKKVVFVARTGSRFQLWLRLLDGTPERPLDGTDNARYPFWSPDSKSVGFFAQPLLKRIDLDSGSVRTVADKVLNGRGGAWNRDGVILYSELAGGPLFRVSSAGGKGEEITQLKSPEQSGHRFPQFLPDGKRFVYYVAGTPEVRGLYSGTLDETGGKRLFDSDSGAVYVAPNQLLYVLQEKLFAQEVDSASLSLKGTPVLVADKIAVLGGVPALSVSETGIIALRGGSAAVQRRLVWFNRSGTEMTAATAADASNPLYLFMDKNERFVAMQREVDSNLDIWLLENGRPGFQRITSDPSIDSSPVISPRGDRIVFSSNRRGAYDLYKTLLTGTANEERILANSANNRPTDWSRSGSLLLFTHNSPQTGSDLWALPMDGNGKEFPVVATKSTERLGQFSPDSKWITYESDETGRYEVYLRLLSGEGEKIKLSVDGGAQSRWNPNGKEVFYLAPDGWMMAVPVQLPENQKPTVGEVVPLFETQFDLSRQGASFDYVVAKNGQQFLLNAIVEEAIAPITVILNWKDKH